MISAHAWLNRLAALGGLLLSGCLDPFPEDPGHSAGDDIAAVQPLPGNTVPAGSGPQLRPALQRAQHRRLPAES